MRVPATRTTSPNITGVYSPGFGDPEQTKRVELIRRILPKAKRLGLLFSPEEQLSVTFKDRMTKAAESAGLEGHRGPGGQRGRGGRRHPLLCGKVDAIELFGNAACRLRRAYQGGEGVQGAGLLTRAIRGDAGAIASFYPDFQEGGVVAGKMIARVLKGESPGTIPFYRLVTTKIAVNPC